MQHDSPDDPVVGGASLHEHILRVPAFAGLAKSEIEQLLTGAEVRELADGECLFTEGAPALHLYVILDGEIAILRRIDGADALLAYRRDHEIAGHVDVMTGRPHRTTARARGPGAVLSVPQSAFNAILAERPGIARDIVNDLATRLDDAEAQLTRRRTLAALGSVAAGLTHELNNPASALVRTGDQLGDAVDAWEDLTLSLAGMRLDDAELATLASLSAMSPAVESASDRIDPLARSEQEQTLQQWLEARGVPHSWQLAPALVDERWDAARLASIEHTISAEHLATVLRWVEARRRIHAFLREMTTSASAISDISIAMKAQTRGDLASIEERDVHDGLERALIILRHKLKNVTVRRDYKANVPDGVSVPGELSQVWINLIDNAADAMDEPAIITIRTRCIEGRLVVEIEDNGAGIPDHVQPRLFEPFFTTKSPDSGSGLGLSTSLQIMQKHGGGIEVETQPGRTRFRVYRPLKAKEGS